MKLPKNLDVLGVKYRISSRKKVKVDHEELDGACFVSEKRIVLKSGADDADRLKTLLHEFGHSFIAESGFWQIIKDDTEEIFCELLSHVLFTNLEKFSKLHQQVNGGDGDGVEQRD